MTPAPDDHTRYRQLFPAYLTGLLDTERTAEVAAHVEQCEECRKQLDRLRENEREEGDHIPAATLARWDRSRTTLKGLQRELVRRHLTECDSCRQALQILGHKPVLERIPALEASPALIQALAVAASDPVQLDDNRVPQPAPGPQPQPSPQLRSVQKSIFKLPAFWFGGAMGGALAAAAALMIVFATPNLRNVVLGGAPVSDHGAPPPGPAHSPTPSPQPASPPTLRLAFAEGTASGLVPSGDPAAGTRGNAKPITLEQGQKRVRVNLEAEDISKSTLVDIQLLDDKNHVVQSVTVSYVYLAQAVSGLTIVSDQPLEPGTVKLRLVWTSADGQRHEIPYVVRLTH